MVDPGERNNTARPRAGKGFRVTRKRDIDRIFATGQRAANRWLTLCAAPNGLARSRAGVGVSRKHGGAVQRNRVKRLCREAFRLVRAELPTGLDFMLIPRAGVELTLSDLQDALRSLTPRLVEKMGSEPAPPQSPPPASEGGP